MWNKRMVAGLWAIYSRCYDGLLDLAPYRELLDDTVKAAEPEVARTVVDLGCGTGNVIDRMLGWSLGPDTRFIGVDSSEEMLRVADRKVGGDHRVELTRSDINSWLRAQATASIDRITSVNALYTFDDAERRTFWEECRRVLTPAGRAVIVTTDREGFWPVVREQYERAGSVRRGLTGRLVLIAVMNSVIWLFESRDLFHPVPHEQLEAESRAAGFGVIESWRSYGGCDDGVAVTVVIEPVVVVGDAERSVCGGGGDERRESVPVVAASDVSDAVTGPRSATGSVHHVEHDPRS